MGVRLCQPCAAELKPFKFELAEDFVVTSVGEYQGWLRDCIIEYKNGADYLAHPLAKLISPGISRTATLVPIPSSKVKQDMRRFDTICLLCWHLKKLESGRSVAPILFLNRKVQDQVGLAAAQRKVNLANAFGIRNQITRPVVLVDDVVTTGATLLEARRILQIAGTMQVSAAVLCGTPKKRYG